MVNDRLLERTAGGRDSGALSRRETEILRLGREGATDKEIADTLGITIATLRTYWMRVRDKLGAVNRTQALVLSAANAEKADEPTVCVRERLAAALSRDRVSTWVWRGRSRQAHLDAVGTALFGLPATDEPIPAERLLAHVWAPDRARFERFLVQGGDLRALTPIEIRTGVPGDYANLLRTANLAADGGSDPSLLLVTTRLHVFR